MNADDPHADTLPGVDARQTAMVTRLPLAPVGGNAVALDCDGGLLSSDAGRRRLKDPEEPRGFTRARAAVLTDPRAPRRVHLPWHALLTPRVWHRAAGSAEANAATTLRHAPLGKLRRARRPDTAPPLASQPTRARCAHHVARTALSRLARVLVEPCRASDARPPQRIVLDVDDPAAPVHGAQAQARYEGDEGGSCCLPRPRSAARAGRLSTPIFQATRCTGTPRLSGGQRLGKGLRPAWPDTLVGLRGDRHWASPEVMPGIEAHATLR